jgi:hypothetical protein
MRRERRIMEVRYMRLLLITSRVCTSANEAKNTSIFHTKFCSYSAALAALCPYPDVEVKIVDDQIEDIPYHDPVNLVGLTAETPHAPRAYEIAEEFRR